MRGTTQDVTTLAYPSAFAPPERAAGQRWHVVFLGGPGVNYEESKPPAWLTPWVAVFWRLSTSVPFELRIPPDGCMDVIGSDVVGSFPRFGIAKLEAGDIATGIRFHPGGFPALFGVPADELVGLRAPLPDVLPRRRSLVEAARSAPLPDPLAAAACTSGDVRELARRSGYSERQLRRRVVAASGHSPKRLMRIWRMQRLLKHGRGESWARTAVEHGYYDEAHMINDVRALVGATPDQLVG